MLSGKLIDPMPATSWNLLMAFGGSPGSVMVPLALLVKVTKPSPRHHSGFAWCMGASKDGTTAITH